MSTRLGYVATLALALLGACDDGSSSSDTSVGMSGSSTGVGQSSGDGGGTAETATVGGTGGSTGSVSRGADSSGGTSGTGSSGDDTDSGADESGTSDSTGSQEDASSDGSTGSTVFPVDCDDGDLPVRVEGGGTYASLANGIASTPPEGTVYICPGVFSEPDTIAIDHPLSVIGAGKDLVELTSGAKLVVGESDGYAFAVTSDGVTLEGLSVLGARRSVDANIQTDLTLRDLRCSGAGNYGVFVDGSGIGETTTTFEDVVVENVTGQSAIRLFQTTAKFTDSTIQDNDTNHGGIDVVSAAVTFEGGRVVRNTAFNPDGGAGARLVGLGTFEILDSDWGEGDADDNVPTDFMCGLGDSPVEWLGAPVSVTCGYSVLGCCAIDA